MEIAYTAKHLTARLLYYSGGVRLLRWLSRKPGRRRGFNVFCYHRVSQRMGPFFPAVPSSAFEAACAYLARHYRVLSLRDLVGRLRSGQSVADAIAITLDDGYRDNFDVALPILRQYGLPATVFLTSGAIGTGEPIWHDRVSWILSRSRRRRCVIPRGERTISVDLDRQEPIEAVEAVQLALKSLPDREKHAAIEDLRRELRVADYGGLARDMLSWDDAREMSRHGITFGGHTVTHPILTRIPFEDAKREILDGARTIEAEVQQPCDTFAYPNGNPEDFDARILSFLADRKFIGAVSRGFEANPPTCDLYDIRRWTPYPLYDVPTMAVRLEYASRMCCRNDPGQGRCSSGRLYRPAPKTRG